MLPTKRLRFRLAFAYMSRRRVDRMTKLRALAIFTAVALFAVGPQAAAQVPGAIPAPPGRGLPITQDGQIVASIVAACGNEPRCVAAGWARVEIERCRRGIFVPGGCVGPNGLLARWSPYGWIIAGYAHFRDRNGQIAARESTELGERVARATGISVDAIRENGIAGGDCSFVRNPFGRGC